MIHLEKIENKDFNEENQSEFKKDALNINTLLYENCNFQNFECDTIRAADYKKCIFNNIHFYWTLFSITEFNNCNFNNCTFAGVTFADCKLIECNFKDCKFIKDNLGGNCSFEDSIICNGSIDKTSSIGFNIKNDDEC